MSKQMRELQARKSTLVQEARALTERAATDNRDMSDEEVSAFDALKTRIDSTSSAIERESSLIAEEAQMAIGALSHARTAHITVTDNRQADPMHGFQSVGEFMQAVYQAEKPGKSLDERLLIGGGRGAAAPLPDHFSDRNRSALACRRHSARRPCGARPGGPAAARSAAEPCPAGLSGLRLRRGAAGLELRH